jgi:putative colanic acid biosynthesis UDP-glucose lipid carrier transferase
MQITGYVSTPYDDEVDSIDLKQLGTLANLDDVLDSGVWSQVLIALPVNTAATIISRVLDCAEERVITVKFVPDTLGSNLINQRIDDFDGTPVMTLRASPLSGYAWIWKAFEDRLIAAVILLLISPVLLVVACGVRLSSPGPILYRQLRVGRDGEEFEMLKFRSMPVNVERGNVQWGGAGSKTNTRFGRFIRQVSLDELPQFINVLKGDMSIVGPRPERTVFVDKFRQEIPGYMHKHLVKAGITGWAQINGWRGDTDLNKRIEYDLYYINHWSLLFDLKIIFLTIFKGFVHSEKASTKTAASEKAGASS